LQRARAQGSAFLTALYSSVAGYNRCRSLQKQKLQHRRGLDLVLGSFHSSLRKTDDQTDRYLAAIRNPHLHIVGHPRGRIYNFRPGLRADWPQVFAAAAKLDKAVEIDCYPDRQDLNLAS
jgi:histidinol phosphatase-like PHP family hydrolase